MVLGFSVSQGGVPPHQLAGVAAGAHLLQLISGSSELCAMQPKSDDDNRMPQRQPLPQGPNGLITSQEIRRGRDESDVPMGMCQSAGAGTGLTSPQLSHLTSPRHVAQEEVCQ